MRQFVRLFALLVMLTAGFAQAGTQEVRNFAMLMGLHDIDGFVQAVESIRDSGHLPDRYLTKNEARRMGWDPGEDLCDSAPGHSIGGDRFGNREGRLPDHRGRRWTEADLDFDCGRRGAKRLVFSSDGLVFVTIDHYDTFYEVPK
ncbi:MAG: hypothetical protein KDG54_06145 [Geminicoccaceae bacterium]|nr:hypothetical protein [Geminicoccaceae bacterium]